MRRERHCEPINNQSQAENQVELPMGSLFGLFSPAFPVNERPNDEWLAIEHRHYREADPSVSITHRMFRKPQALLAAPEIGNLDEQSAHDNWGGATRKRRGAKWNCASLSPQPVIPEAKLCVGVCGGIYIGHRHFCLFVSSLLRALMVRPNQLKKSKEGMELNGGGKRSPWEEDFFVYHCCRAGPFSMHLREFCSPKPSYCTYYSIHVERIRFSMWE